MMYDASLSTGREAPDKETIAMHPLKMQSQELPQCPWSEGTVVQRGGQLYYGILLHCSFILRKI